MTSKNLSFIIGLISSFFFSFTFIFNRSMALTGGNFVWSASLRYYITLIPLFLFLLYRNRLSYVHKSIKKDWKNWLIYSTIGFGLFYLPLTFGASYGTSWLVAATWQFTIIAGTLLTPLFGHKIPKYNLFISIVILIGVFIIQLDNLVSFKFSDTFLCVIPIIIAAIAYPLGNRKTMQFCPKDFTTTERIYAMTLCSMPFWIIVTIIALPIVGLPSNSQLIQALTVSIFSGLLATILFFKSTDMVKDNPKYLSLTESTIAGEIIFALIGGILVLKDAIPNIYGWIGLVIITLGMILNTKTK